MAEGLGVAASAIEVANLGFKLSHSLYDYIATVSTADRRIQEIATKVDLTTAVIQEVGTIFDGPDVKALRKESAVTTARNTLRECTQIFQEIEEALVKSKKNRFLFPFKTSKISALGASLEGLKSNLSLLLHVLHHAHQIATDRKAREEAEDRIRDRDEALRVLHNELSIQYGGPKDIFVNLDQEIETTQKPSRNCKKPDKIRRSLPGTLDDKSPMEDHHTSTNIPNNGSNTTSPQAPSATSELDSCVSALRELIAHIERVQEVISDPTADGHHHGHKQNLSAAYSHAAQTLNIIMPHYCDSGASFSLTISQQAATPQPTYSPENLSAGLFGGQSPQSLAYSPVSPGYSPASPGYSPVSPSCSPISRPENLAGLRFGGTERTSSPAGCSYSPMSAGFDPPPGLRSGGTSPTYGIGEERPEVERDEWAAPMPKGKRGRRGVSGAPPTIRCETASAETQWLEAEHHTIEAAVEGRRADEGAYGSSSQAQSLELERPTSSPMKKSHKSKGLTTNTSPPQRTLESALPVEGSPRQSSFASRPRKSTSNLRERDKSSPPTIALNTMKRMGGPDAEVGQSTGSARSRRPTKRARSSVAREEHKVDEHVPVQSPKRLDSMDAVDRLLMEWTNVLD